MMNVREWRFPKLSCLYRLVALTFGLAAGQHAHAQCLPDEVHVPQRLVADFSIQWFSSYFATSSMDERGVDVLFPVGGFMRVRRVGLLPHELCVRNALLTQAEVEALRTGGLIAADPPPRQNGLTVNGWCSGRAEPPLCSPTAEHVANLLLNALSLDSELPPCYPAAGYSASEMASPWLEQFTTPFECVGYRFPAPLEWQAFWLTAAGTNYYRWNLLSDSVAFMLDFYRAWSFQVVCELSERECVPGFRHPETLHDYDYPNVSLWYADLLTYPIAQDTSGLEDAPSNWNIPFTVGPVREAHVSVPWGLSVLRYPTGSNGLRAFRTLRAGDTDSTSAASEGSGVEKAMNLP